MVSKAHLSICDLPPRLSDFRAGLVKVRGPPSPVPEDLALTRGLAFPVSGSSFLPWYPGLAPHTFPALS